MTARFPPLAHITSFLRSRLSRRITLLVTLSLLLVETAILIPSYLSLQSKLYGSLENDALTTARFTLSSADHHELDGLIEKNWPDLRRIGVAGLAVFDRAGQLRAEKGISVFGNLQAGEHPGQILNRLNESPQHSEREAMIAHRQLRDSDGTYAVFWSQQATNLPFAIFARLETAAIDEELQAFVLRIGGLVLILALVVSATTVAIISREVLAPVLAIHRNLTAAHADPGRADEYKLTIRSSDEIGETVTALNALLDRLTNLRRSDLRVQEQRFRDFASSSSDWFWEMNHELRFSFFSDRFTEVTGVDERELLGKTRQETGIPGVDQDTWAQHLEDLAAHRPFRNFIHPREKQDGKIVWLAISGTPSFDDQGGFLGYRGTGRDITAEVELQSSLRRAKELAEAANRTKSEFLANMSHELRTPLNAVIGFSELLLASMPKDPENPQYHEYLSDIHEAAHHLLSLINDILDLSKIEAGASELNEEVVDTIAVAEAVLRVTRQRADQAGVRMEFRVDEDLPRLLADERKMKQALLNLLTNAVKFTEAGGEVTLEIACSRETGFIFRVIDTGIGMAAEDIPKALHQFGQVDSDLNRKYEGTGLGLPLTKALIELHQGSLEVQSTLGEGTTVSLHLPSKRIVNDSGIATAALARAPGNDPTATAAE